jgi:hypothetical protein
VFCGDPAQLHDGQTVQQPRLGIAMGGELEGASGAVGCGMGCRHAAFSSIQLLIGLD